MYKELNKVMRQNWAVCDAVHSAIQYIKKAHKAGTKGDFICCSFMALGYANAARFAFYSSNVTKIRLDVYIDAQENADINDALDHIYNHAFKLMLDAQS